MASKEIVSGPRQPVVLTNKAGQVIDEDNPLSTVVQPLDLESTNQPFVNPDFGINMNQDVTFSGTPELIFDGGSGGAEWSPTAVQGAWNFADAGKVTITTANTNDEALFEDAGTIDMSNFTAITGKVDLDIYDPVNHSMIFQFGLAGTPVGNSINLNNFINTAVFTEQSFVIPKIELGISTLTVNEMTITILRTGGAKPTIKFDDCQIEELGNPLEFKVTAQPGEKFNIDRLRFLIADNVSSIVTASTTTYPTLQGLSFDTILGVSTLPNGIVVQRRKDNVVKFSASLKQLSDFFAGSMSIVDAISDGTNTFLVGEIVFKDPIILQGDISTNFLVLIINDDLSGLLVFNAFAIGSVEEIT